MQQWINDYAHWVLACIGVSGIYFVGRKTLWGWFVLLFNECLWIAYAIATGQYGFIFAAVAYGAVYIRSYLHWKDSGSEKLSWNNFLKLIWSRKIDIQNT
jgi:hypothetical protein